MNINDISRATLGRLPRYLEFIETSPEVSHGPGARVSSSLIARNLGLGEVLVRKDLSALAGAGRPKTGFDVSDLETALREYIGSDNPTPVIIVGAGRLGTAILNYKGFTGFGVEVVAAFDRSGSKKNDRHIMPLEDMRSYCEKNGIRIAIMAVSDDACQTICDIVIEAGINEILNFSQVRPSVPENVLVEQLNIALSLAALKHSGI